MFTLRRTALAFVALITVGAFALSASPAGSAQFPGTNGKIQYSQVTLSGGNIVASIHLVNPDGSGDQAVIANGWYASQNAAGTKIAYVNPAASGVTNSLHVANFDGSGDTIVSTSASGRQYSATSMSADGTKIVFLDRPSGGPGTSEVMVINVDGTGLTNLTNGAYNGVNGPNISPDGATIVFTSGSPSQLFTIPVTGGSATQITTGAGTRNGSWTPDGKILGTASSDIVRMNADGTGLVTLLSGSTISMASVSWPVASPDGTKMVFSASPQAGSFSLWVSNIDGTNPVRILDTATFGQGIDLALGVWSSNGGAPVTTTTTTAPAADPVVPTFTG